ncbi:MAG: hypothetical protein ACYCYF_02540 [Anaerolineae bacterium]
MRASDRWTRVLAVAGCVLVWLTLSSPLLFSLMRLSRGGRFLFDYLMPAELFPLALAGGLLLLWAALRSQSSVARVAWSLGVAAAALVGSQGLAVVTGLASGAQEAEGWRWALVIAGLAIYILALVALGLVGARMTRDRG